VIEIKTDVSKVSVKDLEANINVDVTLDKVFQVNKDSQDGYDDMVNMENLNEAELLFNIKKRFERQSIFTYVGKV
jgi:myosin heavy subunit